MPVIGVTSSTTEAARRYVASVASRGAEVRLFLPQEILSSSAAIDEVDGLLLTGGPDISSALYHQPTNTGVSIELDRLRDQMEMSLLNEALTRYLPVLGICRGMQLLNVALGGSLLQDISNHRVEPHDARQESMYHRIYLSPGSKLAAIVGTGGFFRVNSRHHQGFGEAQKASDLLTSAYSLEDGLIEAIEMPGNRWVIGVQWHSELEDECPKAFGLLFDALVERAKVNAEKIGRP